MSSILPSSTSTRPPRRFARQSFRRLAREARDVGLPFGDDQFRTVERSVFTGAHYRNRMNIGRLKWMRANELRYDSKRGASLSYNRIDLETSITAQVRLLPPTGNLFTSIFIGPNAWLIAACLAVGQHKRLISKVVRSDDHSLNSLGIVRLNIWQFGTWQRVVLDDKLPCDLDSRPIFARPIVTTNAFWVLSFMEKALAKLYGSYENLATKGSLASALIDLTGGGTVETIPLGEEVKEEEDIEKIISKEFKNKSLLLLKSNQKASDQDIELHRFFLVLSVKRVGVGGGTLGRTLQSIRSIKGGDKTSSVTLMSTIVDSTSNITPIVNAKEITLPLVEVRHKFSKLIITRPYVYSANRIHRVWARQANAQFIFDVTATLDSSDSITITLQQSFNSAYGSVGLRLYSVEMNRVYRVHNFTLQRMLTGVDPVDDRQVMVRCGRLPFGRYLVVPIVHKPTGVPLLLSIDSALVVNVKELEKEKPRYQLFRFTSPHYPMCVSRVIVRRVVLVARQDRFGSANPYCVVRCGKKVVKSEPRFDTLEADWSNLSAIFYHNQQIQPVIIEVWHRSLLLVDNLIGQVEVMPKFRTKEDIEAAKDEEEKDLGQYSLELTNQKAIHNGTGTICFEVHTYEDLQHF